MLLPGSLVDDSTAKQQAVPTWLVTCDNRGNASQLTCSISQTVSNAQTAQRIVSARIEAAQGQERLFLSLPHGLDLLSGVSLSVDGGASTRIAIETADANGSYTSLALGPDLVSSMKAGNTLAVEMVAANGQPVKLELSLAGFTDAYVLFSRIESGQ